MIVINRGPIRYFTIPVEDIVDGKAYENENGVIVIGNRGKGIIAFSICGAYYFDEDCDGKFREIDLEINVK